MITVDGVTKNYWSFTAVDDVSFMASMSGAATISGHRYVDLPNPGVEVGVLLDASAQHAGRTGREILTVAQQFMGLPRSRIEQMWRSSVSRRVRRPAGSATTRWGCGNGSALPPP